MAAGTAIKSSLQRKDAIAAVLAVISGFATPMRRGRAFFGTNGLRHVEQFARNDGRMRSRDDLIAFNLRKSFNAFMSAVEFDVSDVTPIRE